MKLNSKIRLSREEMRKINGGDNGLCAPMGANPADYPLHICCEGKTCTDGFGSPPKCVPAKQICYENPT